MGIIKSILEKVWSFLENNTNQLSSLESIVAIIGAIVGLTWIKKLFIKRKISLFIDVNNESLFTEVFFQDKYQYFMEHNVSQKDWIITEAGSKLKPKKIDELNRIAKGYSFKIRVINEGNTNCENVSIILRKLIVSSTTTKEINFTLIELPKSCQDENYQQNKEIIKSVNITKNMIEDFDFAIVSEQGKKIEFINQQIETINFDEGAHYRTIVSVREDHLGSQNWKLDFDYINGQIQNAKATKFKGAIK